MAISIPGEEGEVKSSSGEQAWGTLQGESSGESVQAQTLREVSLMNTPVEGLFILSCSSLVTADSVVSTGFRQ